jgi:streptomycin 6-kinase
VLHGDIHHDNVLDFGARGRLAIDPKGLLGERGFEFAIFLPTPIWLIRLALSAAWSLGDNDPLAAIGLRIAELVAAELDR